jgi:hypothetical protein
VRTNLNRLRDISPFKFNKKLNTKKIRNTDNNDSDEPVKKKKILYWDVAMAPECWRPARIVSNGIEFTSIVSFSTEKQARQVFGDALLHWPMPRWTSELEYISQLAIRDHLSKQQMLLFNGMTAAQVQKQIEDDIRKEQKEKADAKADARRKAALQKDTRSSALR